MVSKWILPTIKSKLQPSEFAYIPRSGASALTLINHHILKFLDLKSGAVRVVAADFSKAFDKLTFEAIFSALFSFNLCRESVRILFDFLYVLITVYPSGQILPVACLREASLALFFLLWSLTRFLLYMTILFMSNTPTTLQYCILFAPKKMIFCKVNGHT